MHKYLVNAMQATQIANSSLEINTTTIIHMPYMHFLLSHVVWWDCMQTKLANQGCKVGSHVISVICSRGSTPRDCHKHMYNVRMSSKLIRSTRMNHQALAYCLHSSEHVIHCILGRDV